jgi:hypothetical protein
MNYVRAIGSNEPIQVFFDNRGANVTITFVCEEVDVATRLRATIDSAFERNGVRITIDQDDGSLMIEGPA